MNVSRLLRRRARIRAKYNKTVRLIEARNKIALKKIWGWVS